MQFILSLARISVIASSVCMRCGWNKLNSARSNLADNYWSLTGYLRSLIRY